jgi:methyl-accepting chemotaxis protein
VLSAQGEIDKRIGAVDALSLRIQKQPNIEAAWLSIKSDWSGLKAQAFSNDAEQNVRNQSALADRLQTLIEHVTNASSLITDPDRTTQLLVRAATEHITDSMVAYSNQRWNAARVALNGAITGEDRRGMELYGEETLEYLGMAQYVLEDASPEVMAKLSEPFAQLEKNLQGFNAFINGLIKAPNVKLQDIYSAAGKTTEAFSQVSALTYAAARERVQARRDAVARTRNLNALVAAVLLTCTIFLSLLITRAMTRPMNRAIEVFGAVSAGKYDNVIEHNGSDEAAQVLRALDEMQGKLRHQIETERTAAAENARMKQALDSVSSNVMVADEKLDIIYVNRASEKLFKSYEAELRRDVPQLDASRIVGSNIDMFHRNAAQQRQLLTELQSPHTSDMRIGGHAMRIVASPVIDAQGERIGTVLEWFDRTQEVNSEEEVSDVVKAALAGDLAGRVKVEGKTGFFQSLSQGLNQLLEATSEIVRQATSAAADVHRGADEISQGNANLSQRTEEQSSSLEETASSMEEMTSTVKQNADNAAQANQLASAARDQAEKGGTVTGRAVSAMGAINDSSKKIADIIGVIDEIAFQTNLLALNAAVEAARAGEQGRGFAVVASEVRTLAGRSAMAAKEIKELIQDSVKKVEDGSVLVTQSGETLEQIVVSVKKVSDIVAEIAAASREQSSGIDQVNKAVMQMDEMTQQNAALVEQASAASQAMAQQAKTLADMMSRYRISGAAVPGAAISRYQSQAALRHDRAA